MVLLSSNMSIFILWSFKKLESTVKFASFDALVGWTTAKEAYGKMFFCWGFTPPYHSIGLAELMSFQFFWSYKAWKKGGIWRMHSQNRPKKYFLLYWSKTYYNQLIWIIIGIISGAIYLAYYFRFHLCCCSSSFYPFSPLVEHLFSVDLSCAVSSRSVDFILICYLFSTFFCCNLLTFIIEKKVAVYWIFQTIVYYFFWYFMIVWN